MSQPKTQVNANLNEKELELLKQAQEQARTTGKTSSVRAILLRGVYEVMGLDITKET